MKRYCLTLDLKDDPALISEYEAHHKKVWPEIIASIRNAGIEKMEIYRFRNRLCMMMEVTGNFSFDDKDANDKTNAKVQEWETLMLKYQQPFTGSAKGEKWMLMDKIFDLTSF
jgi:L-rhamnose mutarotase